MDEYYSIGELSKKTGLSVHTIRYYDSIGLLKPDYLDENTGYRYYKVSSFWRAEVISLFKSLDISLEELKEILQNRDNQKVKGILKDKKREIRMMISQYRQMEKDIIWFGQMLLEMEQKDIPQVCVRQMPLRTVIYKENQRDEKEYHMTLQKISVNELQHHATIKRKYGYVLNNQIIQNNVFSRKGEYLNLFSNQYPYTDPRYIYEIPAGKYVCQRVKIQNGFVDMAAIREYLKEHSYIPQIVVAEEIGLPLFDFQNFECEIEILVR